MNRKLLIILVLHALCISLIGCSTKDNGFPFENNDMTENSPRLVIRGTVSDEEGKAISGIYVSVINVREANEPNLLTYNYAVTDTIGQYTIIRYRGRELPTEVTVVATDSSRIYQEAYLFAPVRYDSISTKYGLTSVPYNCWVEANFVMKRQ